MTSDARPTLGDVARVVVRTVLLPGAALWLAVVGVGLIVKAVDPAFDPAVSRALEDARTPTGDAVTAVLSGIATTEVLIGTCAVLVLVLWAVTREWWFAITPAIALTLQTAVFLTSSLVVGRERPTVHQLDHAPPTSSFPSGHTGAATAFYLGVAVCAARIRHGVLRWAVWVLCALVPLAVALARTYRGMHHLTDVLGGLAVGVVCAWLARRYLVRVTAIAGRAA